LDFGSTALQQFVNIGFSKTVKNYRQGMEVFLRFAFIAHGFRLWLFGNDGFLRCVKFTLPHEMGNSPFGGG